MRILSPIAILNMGKGLSVDKTPSPLEDTVSTPLAVYSKARDELADQSAPGPHLKLWRFFVDPRDPDYVSCAPLSLSDPSFLFLPTDCYLILVLYKQRDNAPFPGFPQTFLPTLDSLGNLTPRGLETVFCSDTQEGLVSDGVLGVVRGQRSEGAHYLMFLWNGKQASPIVKAMALTKGFELDAFMGRGKENVLKVLGSGAVIKAKKISKGQTLALESVYDGERSMGMPAKRSIYLLQWLWNEQSAPTPPKPLFQKFKLYFITPKPDPQAQLFVPISASDFTPVPAVKSTETKERPVIPRIGGVAEARSGLKMPEIPKLAVSEGREESRMVPELRLREEKADTRAVPDFKSMPKLPIGGKMGVLPLKLSGLKTQEDERKELEHLDKQSLDNLDEDVNIRDTNRKELKLQLYSEICSELMPGLYVGSDHVARDLKQLKLNGITHIVNCAGNVCGNYFPEEFSYLSYFLKDSRMESIESLFHEVVDFIEDAKEEGGSVFVHCMQGVSRSVTVCMAYMIFKQKETFETVFTQARAKRSISSPNFGFQVQLIQWYKRLFEPFDSLAITPRVFAVISHQIEQPHKVVCKLLSTPPYMEREPTTLDPRGFFIVQTATKLFVWEGQEVLDCNYDVYQAAAGLHIQRLREREQASAQVVQVKQGKEPAEFWQCWGMAGPPPNAYSEQELWSQYYPPLDSVDDQEPKAMEESSEEIDLSERAKLYAYPEVTGIGVFEDEELTEEAFVCLCHKDMLYAWQGDNFQPTREMSPDEFIEKVKRHFWHDGAEVRTEYEQPGNESEEFLSFF